MQQEGKLKCFLVMCHRTSILSQWRSSAERLGLRLEDWSESSAQLQSQNIQSQNIQNADGWIVTYQGAASQLQGLKQALESWAGDELLAIADEAHHLGVDPDEPDGPVWGRTFLELSSQARLRLGLTGTPFRADNLAF
jgi:superfamily II DNA or RNA helicase